MSQSITFISRCRACGNPQLQDGYTRAALTRLLERGRIIEADCLKCDVLWPISPEERAAIAEAIAAGHQDAPSSAADCVRNREAVGRHEAASMTLRRVVGKRFPPAAERSAWLRWLRAR